MYFVTPKVAETISFGFSAEDPDAIATAFIAKQSGFKRRSDGSFVVLARLAAVTDDVLSAPGGFESGHRCMSVTIENDVMYILVWGERGGEGITGRALTSYLLRH